MEIGRYERPGTLEEARRLIVEEKGLPLGGGVWTNMTTRSVPLAVDLSLLDLRYIRDAGDSVEIGAMTTARDLEISPVLQREFGSLFRMATEHLVGVQLRNVLTIGGTVAGKYGFSDVNTALAALDANLVFYGDKTVSMMEYLTGSRDKPVLLEKIVVRKGARAAFESVRIANNDFAILNACAAFLKGTWRVAVGARPQAARLCPAASLALGADPVPSKKIAVEAGLAAASEISFGSDTRGSAEYRRAVCPVLVERAIMEACR